MKVLGRNTKFRCKECFAVIVQVKTAESIREFGEQTLRQFTARYPRHQYQKVRAHAHRIADYVGLSKKCSVCGYDKHVELAHKKSIGSFSKDSKLSEINSLENLVYLCPNHHWELDFCGLDLAI